VKAGIELADTGKNAAHAAVVPPESTDSAAVAVDFDHNRTLLTATPSEIGTGWARSHSSAIWAISEPGKGFHMFLVQPVRDDQRPCFSLVLPGRTMVAFTFQLPTPGVAVRVSFQAWPLSWIGWFLVMVWVIGQPR
jgi:hypothetical protein